MKNPWYLIVTASDRMGGSPSLSYMQEDELFKEKNKGMFDCSYISIYQSVDKTKLAAKQKKVKKSSKTLKKEQLESLQEQLARSHRAYRFGGPDREESIKREKLEQQITQLKKDLKMV